MSKNLLVVTTANSGDEALLNAEEFMEQFENFLDSFEIHGAISTGNEIYKNKGCDFDNRFDEEINSYDKMKSLSLSIAKQHLIYQDFFNIVKEDAEILDWIVWFGASKYCTWRAELSMNGVTDLDEYDFLEDAIFPVDFSLHQIAHCAYDNKKVDENTWIVLIDIKL
jgi:hypothetical protein